MIIKKIPYPGLDKNISCGQRSAAGAWHIRTSPFASQTDEAEFTRNGVFPYSILTFIFKEHR